MCRKYDEFFDVIRAVILVQILISSFSMITLIFCITIVRVDFCILKKSITSKKFIFIFFEFELIFFKGYLMDLSIFSASILKLFCAYATLTFQLLIYCYILNFLEAAVIAQNQHIT